MTRSFDPRHLFLVGRLQQRGLALNLEESLTQSYNPLRAALTAFLTMGELGALTYVVQDNMAEGRVEGFAQIRERRIRPEADVIFMAPALADDIAPEAWHHLLTHLCQQAERRSIERLFVSLPETSEAMHLFNQMGFKVYTHEDIFRLTDYHRKQIDPLPEANIRACRSEDIVAVQQLYTAVASRLAQQAENVPGQGGFCGPDFGLASGERQSYILEEQGKAVGYLRVRLGRIGHWLYILLHPQAYDQAKDLLYLGLAALGNISKPVYCGIREYQGGLRAVLGDIGFRPLVNRVLLVKHTTVRVAESTRAMRLALDKRAETSTPTVSPANGHRATGNS